MAHPPLALRLANELIRLGGWGAYRRFQQLARRPREAQRARLRAILQASEGSRFGIAHGFAAIRDEDAYRAQVPLTDHDGLRSWIDQIGRGEQGVLTGEPVLMLEKTSGSATASKYIPYTAALRSEFQRATSVWLTDLYTHRPAMRELGAYWSISPVAQIPELTAGGLRVGFEDDTEYFGLLERWVLRQAIRVPPATARLPDMDAVRYVSLRFLLDDDLLGLFSVWNPSFLSLLLREVPRFGEALVHDLRHGTLTPPGPIRADLHAALARGLRPRPGQAARLARLLGQSGALLGTDLWPRLQLISCWTDGLAARHLPLLQQSFPGVEIQPKGLLATEAFVSFPLVDRPGAVLALDSHFFEFLPAGASTTVLADELEPGGAYEVVVTTGGGLYRYRLNDRIEVVGHHAATPLVRFAGKTDKVCDLVGEKLNELMVASVLEHLATAEGLEGRWQMLAPEWGEPPGYTLFLEAPELGAAALAHLAAGVERGLLGNHHYAYARQLGQLRAVAIACVPGDAEARYLAGCEELGQKAGNVKPCLLHKDLLWRSRLQGTGYHGAGTGSEEVMG